MRTAAALLLGVAVAGAPALTYAQHGGGGGGGGHSGGGGGGHFSGGGGHFAGGFAGGGHFAGGPHFAGAPHVMGGGYFGGAHVGASHYASGGYAFSPAHAVGGAHVAVHGATHYVRPGAPAVGRPGGAPSVAATGYWHGGAPWVGGYWHGAWWPHVWYYPGWAWYLPVLPFGYATYWWGGMPYYYWNNLYYTWSPADAGYIVTDPPPASGDNAPPDGAPYDGGAYEQSEQSGTAAPYDQPAPSQYTAPTGGGAQLFLYPRNGQTDAQIQNDRYECHGWAVNQSGYDPTRPGEGNSAGYRQAMIACLDARGYSAR
jgi:hypothetical protein